MSLFPLVTVIGALSFAQPAPTPAAPAPAQDAVGPYHVIRTFDVGGEGGWDLLCIDSEVRRLYVPRGTHVMVIDADSGAVVGDIPDTDGVHGAAVVPALGKGFTSNGKSNDVTVFDLKTLKTIQTVNAGKNPDAIIYEPVSKRVFVFNGRGNDVTAINAEDLSVAGTLALGGKPELAVADGRGKVFVNTEDTSEVVCFDAQSLKVDQRFGLAPGEDPTGLAFDAPHRRLFAACHNEKMVVLDADTGKVLATPAIGKGVDGAEFDAAGGFAISSNGDGTMTVVATTGETPFTVAQNLKTATRARTMVLDPKTRRIYLPTAEFEAPPAAAEPPKDGANRRPTMKPGTFRIVVVGP